MPSYLTSDFPDIPDFPEDVTQLSTAALGGRTQAERQESGGSVEKGH